MDEQKLMELEAILEASTPGPWVIEKQSAHEFWINAPQGDPKLGYKMWDGLIVTYGDEDCVDEVKSTKVAKSNAKLILTAKEALPKLIEEIRHLRRAIASYHSTSPDEVDRSWQEGFVAGMGEMQRAAVKALEASYDAGAAKVVSGIRVKEL